MTCLTSASVFRFLAHVSSYTETPVVACVVSGFLAALLSLLVSLRDLIEMMSIGTLLAYTLVSGGQATFSGGGSAPPNKRYDSACFIIFKVNPAFY